MVDQLIDEIVEIEWDMFQNTSNIGGRAWCQDDRRQFEINRRAQFSMWDQDSLKSYREDLQAAEQNGWNLVSFKYGYMMEETSPLEYEMIRDQLPVVENEKKEIIERLLAYTLSWCEEFSDSYPKLARRGRPVTSEKGNGYPSVITYARGEMFTYSRNTLECLLALYQRYATQKINVHEAVVEKEIRQLCGMSLKEMEERM